MGEMLKQLYTKKSFALGWALGWRAAAIVLLHYVVLFILFVIAAMLLPEIVQTIFMFAAVIFIAVISIASYGWAAQRIKDQI